MVLRIFSSTRQHSAGRLSVTALLYLALLVDAAAQQPFVHANAVAFSIRTDQKQYQIGDQIVIHYTIRNVSNGPIFVPRSQWDIECASPPHLWAALEASSGKYFEPGYAGSCLGSVGEHMKVTEKMAKDALLLKPGQSVNGHFDFDSRIFVRELQPGVYRLKATLYGWNGSYTLTEQAELSKMGAPLLIGEAHATIQIKLTARRTG